MIISALICFSWKEHATILLSKWIKWSPTYLGIRIITALFNTSRKLRGEFWRVSTILCTFEQKKQQQKKHLSLVAIRIFRVKLLTLSCLFFKCLYILVWLKWKTFDELLNCCDKYTCSSERCWTEPKWLRKTFQNWIYSINLYFYCTLHNKIGWCWIFIKSCIIFSPKLLYTWKQH